MFNWNEKTLGDPNVKKPEKHTCGAILANTGWHKMKDLLFCNKCGGVIDTKDCNNKGVGK